MHRNPLNLASLAVAFLVLGCAAKGGASEAPGASMPAPVPEGAAVATFAGGCFWCVEAAFDDLPGVLEAVSGYSGGAEPHPTYEEVSAGRTGHLESVRVSYDPSRVSYDDLLDRFWRQIDPTDDGGQFADRGPQYRTAIFVHDATQRGRAEASKRFLETSGWFERPIATRILGAATFHPAEAYHQDYHRTHAEHYLAYKHGSGRGPYLERVWKSKPRIATPSGAYARPSDEELRGRLTPLQYHVTREDGTEPAFANEFWDDHRAGIYVDRASGEPLFSSKDKFDSGTGWPSFTRPLAPANVVERTDASYGMTLTEVRSRHGDSHLGHLFPDGPKPTGLRYCINSAALRFVPAEKLADEGYAEFTRLFE